MTSYISDPVRQRMDKENALSDLVGEGWDISGLYPKMPDAGVKSWGVFQRYALERLLHRGRD